MYPKILRIGCPDKTCFLRLGHKLRTFMYVILNLYNKLSKFNTSQNIMKQFYPWAGRGHIRNKACHERN